MELGKFEAVTVHALTQAQIRDRNETLAGDFP